MSSYLFQIKAETLILQGDPKDKICQAAEELHVDLVVLGSRGLGPIKRYITYIYIIQEININELNSYILEVWNSR